MVKTVRIGLDDLVHEEFLEIKGERTWQDVLYRGIKSIRSWPKQSEWTKAILTQIDEAN